MYQIVVVYTADVCMLQVELLQGLQPTHFSDRKLVGLQFRIKAPIQNKSSKGSTIWGHCHNFKYESAHRKIEIIL